jgi:hypothetical protein
VSYDIFEALAFGVSHRPELEVRYSIVGSVPIAMMNDFVGLQGTPEVQGHNQPVFSDPSCSAN